MSMKNRIRVRLSSEWLRCRNCVASVNGVGRCCTCVGRRVTMSDGGRVRLLLDYFAANKAFFAVEE